MAVINITEARVNSLDMGSGIWRDEQVKGLLVICHKTSKTYAVQGDVRRNGRFIRTVRLKIERCDRMGLREARRKAMELMAQIQGGVDPTAGPESSAITLADTLEKYIDARKLSPATVVGYRYHVDKYMKHWRKRAVVDISRGEVRDLFDELKRKSGETTASAVMRTLRALVNEAQRYDDAITINPVMAIRMPQMNKRQVAELNMPGWWANVNELTPERRDLHIFLLFSGLRRRSATRIRRDDVNIAEGTVRVRHMKSGRAFVLPLSGYMKELLQKRMDDDVPLNSPWLWPSPYSKSGHIEEPREVGLPSPHEYRHLWRTFSIAAGVPYAESALLLDQRLPGASGGYIHPEHLVEHLRQYQESVTAKLCADIKKLGK